MKVVIVALLLLSLALCKDYAVVSEEIIKRVNNDKSASWTAGHNDIFKGKTLSQVRHLFGAFLVDPRSDLRPRITMNVAKEYLPKTFDSRTQWPKCVHAVRNQGQCGSCWAFSASEVLSDRFCVASNGRVNVVLSPQDMVSCDSSNYGCQGGYLDKAWVYLKNKGIVTDKCFPYKSYYGSKFPCPTEKKCVTPGVEYKKYFAKNEYVGYFGDAETSMKEISTNGPIQTGFRVYQDFFSYKKGVYHHVSGGFAGGHAVKVVGWGVDNASGKNYWIVANSWGPNWGIDGFFWIQKGSDECGIESQMIAGHADV